MQLPDASLFSSRLTDLAMPRAASVMEALGEINSSYHFDIFTTVPKWFFANGHLAYSNPADL
jgi:hypothetical protein